MGRTHSRSFDRVGLDRIESFDDFGEQSPTPPSPPSPPFTGAVSRPCCMLAPMSFTLEPTALGSHTDIGGILYTGKAGFVDLGHVRDIADLTGFVYQQIHGASGARGTSITTIEGTAQLTRALAQSEWLEVARSI